MGIRKDMIDKNTKGAPCWNNFQRWVAGSTLILAGKTPAVNVNKVLLFGIPLIKDDVDALVAIRVNEP